MNETLMSATRALYTVALVLDPDQREEAARRLRDLPSDDPHEIKLMNKLADVLDLSAAETRIENQ